MKGERVRERGEEEGRERERYRCILEGRGEDGGREEAIERERKKEGEEEYEDRRTTPRCL